jgi:hypothetical protein
MFCVTNHFRGHLPSRLLTLAGKPGIIIAHNNEQVHLNPVFLGRDPNAFADSNSSFRKFRPGFSSETGEVCPKRSSREAQVEVNS